MTISQVGVNGSRRRSRFREVGGGEDPALALLRSATFWIDAAHSSAGEQSAVNRGSGGSALDAQYGSTSGADTNDPLLATQTVGSYLYLPGTGGNLASTPDSAVFSPTDIDVRSRVALSLWGTNGVNYQTIAAHSWDQPAAGTNYGWLFAHYGSRRLALYLGTATGSVVSDVAFSDVLAFANDELVDVRVTRVQSTGQVSFFWKNTTTALDVDSGWTALGGGVVRAGGALFAATGSFQMGACGGSGASLPTQCKIHRCLVKGSVGGAVTFDADFTRNTSQTTFAEFSSNAATVTINRSTTGRKAAQVVRPIWLFATDDQLASSPNALFNFAAGESLTLLAVGRSWDSAASFGTWAATKPIAGPGLYLGHNSTTRQVHGSVADAGTNVSATTTAAAANGALSVVSLVRNVTADTVTAYLNATAGTPVADTTTTSLASVSGLLVGRSPGPSIPQDAEIAAVALFRKALTTEEIAQIVSYYGAA